MSIGPTYGVNTHIVLVIPLENPEAIIEVEAAATLNDCWVQKHNFPEATILKIAGSLQNIDRINEQFTKFHMTCDTCYFRHCTTSSCNYLRKQT